MDSPRRRTSWNRGSSIAVSSARSGSAQLSMSLNALCSAVSFSRARTCCALAASAHQLVMSGADLRRKHDWILQCLQGG
jgi:hypothetical protein